MTREEDQLATIDFYRELTAPGYLAAKRAYWAKRGKESMSDPIRSSYIDVSSSYPSHNAFHAALGYSRIPHSQLFRAARFADRIRIEIKRHRPDRKLWNQLATIEQGLLRYPSFIPMGLVDSNL